LEQTRRIKMAKEPFGGAGKVGESLLAGPEKRLVAALLPKVPRWLETYHLTMMTLLWSALVVLFGWLARENLHWLWGSSVMIVGQYLTDLFDGAVGRRRNTGLIKWGFFMDHFLDYIFLCSLILAYYLVAPAGYDVWFIALLGLTGGHMVHSFLAFAATNEFRISFAGLGPTETRIGFIIINTVIILTWPDYYDVTIPLLTFATTGGLVFVVYRTQRRLWKIDMENKRRPEPPLQDH
jgi:phosphatidylglycerophosphate synthase